MSKQKLFLDFDGTMADSLQACCDVYNTTYNECTGFVKAIPDDCNRWDMKDICPLYTDVNELFFSNPVFFDVLKPMWLALCVLHNLSDKYDIIVTTIGTPRNIALKSDYIDKHFPMIKEKILLSTNGSTHDKTTVNMEGGIIIDDKLSNVATSNASKKYVFGRTHSWNENSPHMRLRTWLDVSKELYLK